MIALSKGLSVWFPSWIQDPSITLDQKDPTQAVLAEGFRPTEVGDFQGGAYLLDEQAKPRSRGRDYWGGKGGEPD